MTGLSRGGWRILARTAQAAHPHRRAAACDVRRRAVVEPSGPSLDHLMRPTRGAVLIKLCRTVQESRCSRV